MTAEASADSPRSVLRRALSIIDMLGDEDEFATLTEISRRTGIPKATAHRLINELLRWGALKREGHYYSLGARLFVLGERVPTHSRLRDAAMPFLSELHDETRESANLCVLRGSDVLYLARLAGHNPIRMNRRAGTTLPAHETASGKVLPAYSPAEAIRLVIDAGPKRMTPHTIVMPGFLTRHSQQVASRGYAVSTEEAMRGGIVAVAAPVLDANRKAVAAVSVFGRAGRIDPPRVLPVLAHAARSLSKQLRANSALGVRSEYGDQAIGY